LEVDAVIDDQAHVFTNGADFWSCYKKYNLPT